MALKKITAADYNAAIKKLTTSNASVWWKTLGTTEDGTELCFVMGWSDGYDEDDEDTMYQQDGYTLCSKIGYKHSNLSVMDYSDFYMPYDKKSGNVWDTDTSVDKGKVTDDSYVVKMYNDEASQIWSKYGKPNRDGLTALDLMESKNTKGESKMKKCSMQKKKESLSAKKSKKCEGLMDDLPYDAPVAIESLCAEIMSHAEEFTIEDADVAEMCGKWYIRDYANGPTAAHNEEEWVDEVLTGLSGSPVDGSPFGVAEAEEYAHKVFEEELAE
jgi:hypothetical protein